MDSVTTGEAFVKKVLSELVDYPDELRVRGSVDERGVLISVWPHAQDVGRVIGRGGSTIESLRMITRALGAKNGAFYSIKVFEDVA